MPTTPFNSKRKASKRMCQGRLLGLWSVYQNVIRWPFTARDNTKIEFGGGRSGEKEGRRL